MTLVQCQERTTEMHSEFVWQWAPQHGTESMSSPHQLRGGCIAVFILYHQVRPGPCVCELETDRAFSAGPQFCLPTLCSRTLLYSAQRSCLPGCPHMMWGRNDGQPDCPDGLSVTPWPQLLLLPWEELASSLQPVGLVVRWSQTLYECPQPRTVGRLW